MTFAEYQNFAKQNHRPGCDDMVFALGLGGETGEVLEILKKARRDQVALDISHLKEELGDVMWYVANLCTAFGLSLEEVLNANVHKLCERYAGPVDYIRHTEDGYSYRMNGPHIEKLDAATGKHIKFCGRKEVPPYILERLGIPLTAAPTQQGIQEDKNEEFIPTVGGNCNGKNDCPFD